MATISALAPAKLNLFLHVTGKHSDLPMPERSRNLIAKSPKHQDGFAQAGGYHLLESLVAFVEFGDSLEIEPADTLTLEVTGPFAAALQQSDDNIVTKAAHLLKEHARCEKGARIILKKNLPVGAGMGGGSSDAAAVLFALQALWDIHIDNDSLLKIALQLGSDVPVCLAQRMAWVQGVGEQVTPITMQADVWVVLVNPGLPLLTADVFRRFSGAFSHSEKIPQAIDSFDALIHLIQLKRNDLEIPAITLAPVIGDVLVALRATKHCRLTRMSGSGATCFGLYNNAKSAELAAEEIKRRHPNWWSVAAMLNCKML